MSHLDFQLPQHTIFYQLEKTIKVYRKLAQDHINQSGYDISLNQLLLLFQLIQRPESTQVELSEYVFKDFASIARMVDLLVKKGYIKRSENKIDRRKKDLVPTEPCKKLIEDLMPVIENYRSVALQGFGEEELQALSQHLNHITANCLAYA